MPRRPRLATDGRSNLGGTHRPADRLIPCSPDLLCQLAKDLTLTLILTLTLTLTLALAPTLALALPLPLTSSARARRRGVLGLGLEGIKG